MLNHKSLQIWQD